MAGADPMAAPTPMPARRAVRIRVRGAVQGVGFRPFVYRLALSLDVAGEVRNDDEGVRIEAEGDAAGLAAFIRGLGARPPGLARVAAVEVTEDEPRGRRGFAIVPSDPGRGASTPVTPDAATCAACLAELLDPSDRRHRYPFINCTECGPRFTIITGTPYDRPRTTMAAFRMCAACAAEYDDPGSRRFHAQPNACPACGPRVRLVAPGVGPDTATGTTSPDHPDAVSRAAALLRAGRVLAVKGIGGYHLACRADEEAAVARLRRAKRREEKPFALMVRDLDAAAALAEVEEAEAALLSSAERPIVLVRRRRGAAVADSVALGAPELGIMLPYSPLHHLLLADAGVPLVMTSGNVSDEPIAHEDDDAAARLGGLADALLVHDRPIRTRTDDSVARIVAGGPLVLRRSRGRVPDGLDLPVAAPPLLACGAQLKSTFCLADGRRAIPSHHIGDLENFETLASYRAGIAHFERLFRIRPTLIVHDLHPDYLSTREGLDRAEAEGLRTLGVQHHHAHLAACLAEHGETGPAVGAIFDGTGYGTDGTVWGGELLVGDLGTFTRVGHLRAVPLPGGDAAIREPWRMACAWLCALRADDDVPPVPSSLAPAVDRDRWDAVARLTRSGVASPLTTSMGRLFDAVAALCGVRARVTYEGQAAVELERVADRRERGAYGFELRQEGSASGFDLRQEGSASGFELRREDDGRSDPGALPGGGDGLLLDPGPALRALLRDLDAGVPVPTVAARFHNGVAEATWRACAALAEAASVGTVVLSGGVYQNALLLERVAARLRGVGLDVLVPRRLPPNDGGIAFGQAAVAAARSGR